MKLDFKSNLSKICCLSAIRVRALKAASTRSRRWPGQIPLLAFTLLACTPFGALGEDYRTWTDVEGREMSASLEYHDRERGMIEVRHRNGRLYTIPVERLSERDQKWLKTQDAGEIATDEHSQNAVGESTLAQAGELPDRHRVRNVRMVVQKGAYCVPASAEMIARHHGIRADQDLIARLSSEGSVNHQGTNPMDMAAAMNNFGLEPYLVWWTTAESFREEALPKIKQQLIENGPMYVSFAPGVFGDMGHGCVLVGFEDRTEKLYLYNPWGNEFDKSYDTFAKEGRGAVGFRPSGRDGRRDPELGEKVRGLFAKAPGSLREAIETIERAGLRTELRFGVRKDARNNHRFAERTGRDEGRNFIYYAFNRAPVVLITQQEGDDSPLEFALLELSESNRNHYQFWRLDKDGWRDPEVGAATRPARHWASRIEYKGEERWDLPLIDIHRTQP